jgi:DNA-binding NtrC family response regulator
MGHGNTVQVVLVAEGRPTRILAERPLGESGRAVVTIQEGTAPTELLSGQFSDAIRFDLRLADGAGSAVLVRRSGTPEIEEVVVTERPLVPEDETYLYLTRPLDRTELQRLLRQPAPATEAPEELPRWTRDPDAPIFGPSPANRDLWRTVARVADSSASVLIRGETGSGKTLVARALHRASSRGEHAFVVINCSAFQDQLLESELFGHEKGAFTGAATRKPGLFEVADGGTLFLDEVAEMSPAMQAKLLQVLDSGEFRRVGGTRLNRADARIVAATNKDLDAEAEAGRFRRDLLFRLNVVTLSVPPLRQRLEDIPPLIDGFLQRFRRRDERAKQISPRALEALMRYPWPGNVRELANTVEGLTLLAPGATIRLEDLPPGLRHEPETRTEPSSAAAASSETGEPPSLREVERLAIARALEFTEGKKAPAARLLGIDIKTLTSKVRSYGIEG